ncbi:MAG: trypsin-like peptidase domain-containing protein, partial [bacterium]|nr:trypsin-like peptidase domain-containing protein [bacterium]
MKRYEGSTVMASLRKSMRVFLIGTSVFLAGVLVSVIMTGDTVSAPRPPSSLSDYEVVPKEGNIHSTFTAVASKVRPAVVYIKTERSSSSRGGNGRAPFDFFRDMLPEGEERPRGRRAVGGGSGFIIDKEGRILTNHHVIREADRITVVLGDEPNEREFNASVVGFDALTDIAIIQIDTDENLPVVVLGDSDEMLVGDWVMAIGTPFGQLSGSVTVGVVSAKGRTDLRIMGGNQNG